MRRLREVSLLESDIEPRRLSRHRLTALAYGELIDASGPTAPDVRSEARVVSLSQDRSIGTATGGPGAASLRPSATEPPRRTGGFGAEVREARDEAVEPRDQSFRDVPSVVAAEEGRESAAPGAHPSAYAITIEIDGVRGPLPAGVQPVLEQDADGTSWYRIGAVRLGPLRFTP